MEELQEKVGKDIDEFDLICHVAFDMPPLIEKKEQTMLKSEITLQNTVKRQEKY